MLDKLKYVGLSILAMTSVITGYFFGNDIKDKAISTINELTTDEVGSVSWFKKQEVLILSYQNHIKDIRYNLNNSTEWNTRIVLQFSLDDSKLECSKAVNLYNEQAALKSMTLMDLENCK